MVVDDDGGIAKPLLLLTIVTTFMNYHSYDINYHECIHFWWFHVVSGFLVPWNGLVYNVKSLLKWEIPYDDG